MTKHENKQPEGPAIVPQGVAPEEMTEAPAQAPDPAPALLAEMVYDRTAQNKVAGGKWLRHNKPDSISAEKLDELLSGVREGRETGPLAALACIRGKKDSYYYDATIMTRQFASLDALIEDKDILATIASVTRSDCELYPRPTEFSKMTGYPFRYTLDEVEGAAARMALDERYADIGVVQASNGEKAFYSDRFIKKGYAQSLLEYSEVESKEWP